MYIYIDILNCHLAFKFWLSVQKVVKIKCNGICMCYYLPNRYIATEDIGNFASILPQLQTDSIPCSY